ncbi:VOC family protein [Cognatishimia sp. MH4019]|uniref:VOC family protein n=1 Tax=Cognatishimia sp. MH4019 TaxID=2854030 RepID=UPI001CD74F85|nr:VOC family protein [Cognatishimia sp. MH4019]
MISHITLGTSDLTRARQFYAPLMEALGWSLVVVEDAWMGWTPKDVPRPLFVVGLPEDDAPASVGNGTMIALMASDRAAVRDGHAAGLAQGGTDAGAPGPRPQYHVDFYGAYLRDPDGNKLCLCCHDPEPGHSDL